MTTIVTKGGWVVAESALTNEKNRRIGDVQKIFRLEYGHIYGSCGDDDDRELRRLLHNVKTPEDMPLPAELKKIDADLEAIVVFKSGEVWDICTGKNAGACPINDSHFAIGSGRQIATGALDAFDRIPSDWSMEKKVRTAVLIACERDIFSRGPLQVMKL